jgi:hypothetical protein
VVCRNFSGWRAPVPDRCTFLFGDLLGGPSADTAGTVTLKFLTSHQHLAPMGHHGMLLGLSH